MLKIISIAGAALAVASLAITPALAQGADAAIQKRVQAMRAMGGDLRAVSEQLRQPAPDAAAMKESAAKVKAAADGLGSWFPAGTGPEAGKTRAKAEIWSDAAGWNAEVAAYKAEVDKLNTLVAGTDNAATLAQAQAVNGQCASCHGKFRGPPPQ